MKHSLNFDFCLFSKVLNTSTFTAKFHLHSALKTEMSFDLGSCFQLGKTDGDKISLTTNPDHFGARD